MATYEVPDEIKKTNLVLHAIQPVEAEGDVLTILEEYDSIIRVQKRGIMKMQEEKLRRRLRSNKEKFLAGISRDVQRVHDLAFRLQHSDAPVLIMAETGCGKELIAQEIQCLSLRHDKPYIKLNCSSFPESLFESELFGYEAGSFTGASKQGKVGLFEAANGGTLFLDEIGDASLSVQARLLRVLEEKEVMRVGDTKVTPIDVRVIAATNRDLQKCVTEGAFREDLYYRLSVFPVWVPPLRERKLDIPKLAASVIEELNQTYEHKKSLTVGAEATLLQYPWPGNVRELRNVMERAFIMSDGEEIQAEDLAILDNGSLHTPKTISPTYGVEPQHPQSPAPAPECPPLTEESLQAQVERFEAALIAQALAEAGSLRRLQMDPATLLRRKKKYQAQRRLLPD